MSSSLVRPTLIRRIRPDESDLYRDFLLDLDPQSRRDRFCGSVSDEYLIQHAQRILASGTVLYGCFHDGRLCGAAELHTSAPGELAEAAFVVSPDLQQHGIGTALLDAIVLAARRHHPVIRVTCLRGNEAMRRLAQKADARLALTYDEAQGEIHTPRPTALSWMREAFVDAVDTVVYTMRWPPKPRPQTKSSSGSQSSSPERQPVWAAPIRLSQDNVLAGFARSAVAVVMVAVLLRTARSWAALVAILAEHGDDHVVG